MRSSHMRQLARFVVLLLVLGFVGCEQWPGQTESGVCHPEEHSQDSSNCGCVGP